jgi:hypothetical protein
MSNSKHKSHNVTVLLYHLVFPAKYRRVVFDEHVESVLKEVCLDVACPVRAVYLSGRFLQQHRPCTVATALLPQQ